MQKFSEQLDISFLTMSAVKDAMKILFVPELETSLSILQPWPFLAGVCVYYLNIGADYRSGVIIFNRPMTGCAQPGGKLVPR